MEWNHTKFTFEYWLLIEGSNMHNPQTMWEIIKI